VNTGGHANPAKTKYLHQREGRARGEMFHETPRIRGNSSGRNRHNVRNPAVRKVGYAIAVRLVHLVAWVQVVLAVSEIRVLPR
jgi:hypothetical protein